MTLQDYSSLANEILEESTDYIKSKKLIYSFFEHKDNNLTLEKIILRLTIIDSIYSTNMNRRLFGIKDLAIAILYLANNDDNILIAKINNFISKNTDEQEISNFIIGKFGIDKKGHPKKHATSLISKYFYFLLKFNFPIYDSLVKENLPRINDKFSCMESITLDKGQIQYFKDLIEFNKKSLINDFNKLDNMCWLYGKVNRGSFSLILDKEKYIKLILSNEKLKVDELDNKLKSNEIDSLIKANITINLQDSIFTEKQIKFIKWVNT